MALISLMLVSCAQKKPQTVPLKIEGEEIKIELSGIKEGVPYFLSLPEGEKKINFFVLRINNEIRSYFDACLKCYPKKLGYRQDADRLVCRACGVGYSLDALDGVASCYPIPLEGKVQGSAYVIKKEHLIKGLKYF